MSKFCSVLVAAIACVLAAGCPDDAPRPPPPPQTKLVKAEPSMPEPPGKSAIVRRKGKESPCTGGKCLPVPRGIKGLTFGMSRKAAEAVVGKTRRGKKITHRVRVEGTNKGPCNLTRIELPGESRTLKTTLGGEKARCRLDFADSALSNIECNLAGRRKSDAHKEVVDALLASLWRRYGWESHAAKRDLYNNQLTWSSDDTKLVVITGHRGKRSTISVINRAREHHDSIERAAREAVDACKAKIAAEADDRKRKKLEKEAELLRKSMEFESDFLPPLEGTDSP